MMQPSSPYLSNITVSGLIGVITNMNVTINTIQHTQANDTPIPLITYR